MIKSYVQLGLGVSLAVAVLGSFAFQESPNEAPASTTSVATVKPVTDYKKPDEVERVKKELEELKKDLSVLNAKSNEEIKSRESNLRKLEKESVELKSEVKTLRKAVGTLVNTLRNFPADSTLKTFDMEAFPSDTIKKKGNVEVYQEAQKRPGLLKRLFKRN